MKQDFVVHTPEELLGIRKAAQAAAAVRENLRRMSSIGMTTKDLDVLAGALIASTGGKSAFLGYRNFPGQICISLNDEVVHGIGKVERMLQNGDVLSLDVGILLDGFIGDTATTIVIGENKDPEVGRLLKETQRALDEGIKAAKVDRYVKDISRAIENVAISAKLGIVREYVGHGCGIELHEPPEIPNFTTTKRGPQLKPGMVLAIEPMFNLGTYRVFTETDGWTVRTIDGRVSAHFEHMVLITDSEPEILTWLKM